jgi:hypothetical protein
MSQDKEPNQGEGDRTSARRYDGHARTFVAEGKVDDAARSAKAHVEQEPGDAARAERAARRGPGKLVTLDELVAKGQSVVDRVRRLATRVRARIARKREAK